MNMPTPRSHASRARRCVWVLTAAVALAACAPGGHGASSGGAAPSAVSTDLGTKPVTLKVLVSTPNTAIDDQRLGKAFHAIHPNVTVKVIGEAFNTLITNAPRILAGTDVPDLMQVAAYGNIVKDGLVTNLDPYAKAYGWDRYPQSQYASLKTTTASTQRGRGSLYGVPTGFGLTGVYYNKAQARRLGMRQPPATLAEFEQLLAKAKSAGLLPMMDNGQDGGTVYPFQHLFIDYSGSTRASQNWSFTHPGATINNAAGIKAATTLRQWAASGYFPADVNSLTGTQATTQFAAGKGVFYPTGNWQAPVLDKTAHGKFGFFPFPPASAGAVVAGMSAPSILVVPAKAAHKDVAAAFLNFTQNNARARALIVNPGGLAPGGPANAAVPATPAGSAVGATLAAFNQLNKSNGLVEFMQNATPSISVSSFIPQTQLLLGGKTSPKSYVAKIQSDYRASAGG